MRRAEDRKLGRTVAVKELLRFDEGAVRRFAREAEMLAKFSKDGTVNPDVGGQVLAYSAAKVLMDGISQAGSTKNDDIVAALQKLEGDYPFGHVKFGDNHAAATPTFMGQWEGPEIVAVTTAEGKAGPAKPVIPVAGLQ